MTKNMIYGSMAAAGIIAVLSVLDMIAKIPFAGYSLAMDICFLLASSIILYMGWETFRENQ